MTIKNFFCVNIVYVLLNVGGGNKMSVVKYMLMKSINENSASRNVKEAFYW